MSVKLINRTTSQLLVIVLLFAGLSANAQRRGRGGENPSPRFDHGQGQPPRSVPRPSRADQDNHSNGSNNQPREQHAYPRPKTPSADANHGAQMETSGNSRPVPRRFQGYSHNNPPHVNHNAIPGNPPAARPGNSDRGYRPVRAARRPEHYWPRQTYSAYNPCWRYAHLPRRNTVVTNFYYPYQTIYFGGFGYRYCDGIFYQPFNSAFRVIAPPFGIRITILPFGYRSIFVNDYPYYYYNGTYYDDYEDGYRVVAPPVGAIVESIPDGYETITIDGETYYKVDNVQYKPVVQENGEIWYQVIKVGQNV